MKTVHIPYLMMSGLASIALGGERICWQGFYFSGVFFVMLGIISVAVSVYDFYILWKESNE